jgi:hypothetical protein
MNKCISSSNNFDISNVDFDISNVNFDISNVNFTISNANFDNSNVNFDISNVNFDISYDASYSIIYKTNKPKPKKTLLQKIIKLHKFLCYQAATLLILTIILSSFCKCYDVLIYASFGTFISMMFFGAFGLLLKFKVIASREHNEKFNYNQCYYWKKYVQLPESFLFTIMATYHILMHVFYGFLALYYVKTFIKNSISTKYSYIIGYLLIILFFAINYNSGFKLYNYSLKCTVDEYNKGIFLTLLVVGGLIYYFETIKVSI